MIVTQKDILAYFAVVEKGDWDHIYERIQSRESPDPAEVRKVVDNIRSKFVTIGEKDYPPMLANMWKPPFCLFYYGDITWTHLPESKPLAVIGSRDCSEYGVNATKKIVAELAHEFPIVSGLAAGIDTVALQTAIDSNGKAIAVIGSGLDYYYPSDNKGLQNFIKKHHLLISEYPEGTPPSQNNFPMRNRIIAGISNSVIVTEAGLRSGTSITVSFALLVGKDVMCVPHPIGKESACNRLIKEGAFLIENGQDVRESLTLFCKKKYYYGL